MYQTKYSLVYHLKLKMHNTVQIILANTHMNEQSNS